MSDPATTDMVERAARALIVHMDVFAGGHDPQSPAPPATAAWEDYSRVEQASARLAARAAIDAALSSAALPEEPSS